MGCVFILCRDARFCVSTFIIAFHSHMRERHFFLVSAIVILTILISFWFSASGIYSNTISFWFSANLIRENTISFGFRLRAFARTLFLFGFCHRHFNDSHFFLAEALGIYPTTHTVGARRFQ